MQEYKKKILQTHANIKDIIKKKKLLQKKKYYEKKLLLLSKRFFSTHKKIFFLLKHIIMVNLTTHELKLIAKKRNIQDYKKISREELLRTFDESEHF